MATEISHDAYARQSVMRKRCNQFQSCTWCGNRARWKYGIQADDSLRGVIHCRTASQFDRESKIRWSNGQYCSIGCYRQWNG